MPTLTSASSDLFKAVYFEAKTFAYCPDLDKRQSYRTYFDSKDVKGDYVEAIDVLAASGIDLEQLEHLYKVRLGSVAGPVIQATGRSEFEDGLGSGDFVSGCSYHMRLSVALGCLIIQCKPNSKANGLAMLKHLFPLFEYRS
jgi:hypothetical protein